MCCVVWCAINASHSVRGCARMCLRNNLWEANRNVFKRPEVWNLLQDGNLIEKCAWDQMHGFYQTHGSAKNPTTNVRSLNAWSHTLTWSTVVEIGNAFVSADPSGRWTYARLWVRCVARQSCEFATAKSYLHCERLQLCHSKMPTFTTFGTLTLTTHNSQLVVGDQNEANFCEQICWQVHYKILRFVYDILRLQFVHHSCTRVCPLQAAKLARLWDKWRCGGARLKVSCSHCLGFWMRCDLPRYLQGPWPHFRHNWVHTESLLSFAVCLRDIDITCTCTPHTHPDTNTQHTSTPTH